MPEHSVLIVDPGIGGMWPALAAIERGPAVARRSPGEPFVRFAGTKAKRISCCGSPRRI